MLSRIAASLALAAVVVQPALAAPTQCITATEFHAGARFIMPILIDAVAKRCSPTLGDKSYLSTTGSNLVQRYAAQTGDEIAVSSLVGKIDEKHDMKGLDAADLKAFASVAVAKGLGDELKPETCPTIDKVLALLDPMPADNTIGLVEVILRQVDADDAKKAARLGRPAKHLLCPET